jgi:hypothetical protein
MAEINKSRGHLLPPPLPPPLPRAAAADPTPCPPPTCPPPTCQPPTCPPPPPNAAAAADASGTVILIGKVIYRRRLFPSWKTSLSSSSLTNTGGRRICGQKRKRSENNNNNNNNDTSSIHQEEDNDDEPLVNGDDSGNTTKNHSNANETDKNNKNNNKNNNNDVAGNSVLATAAAAAGNDIDIDIDDDDGNDDLFAGWIFQCSKRSSSSRSSSSNNDAALDHQRNDDAAPAAIATMEEYVLSVPAHWTRDIAIAVSHSYTVHIQHYQILPLPVVESVAAAAAAAAAAASTGSHASSSASSSTAAAAAAAAVAVAAKTINNNSSTTNFMNGRNCIYRSTTNTTTSTRLQQQQQQQQQQPRGTRLRQLLQVLDQDNAVHVVETTTTTTITMDQPPPLLSMQQQHDDDNDNHDDLWTLRQLSRLEAVDRAIAATTRQAAARKKQQQQQQQQQQKQHHHELLSLSCLVVEAISPVICTSEKDDPFCLVQVHDNEQSCRHGCVVVLKGEKCTTSTSKTTTTTCPLAMLPALWPGRAIARIQDVRPSMRWKIPELLLAETTLTNNGRGCCSAAIPQRVFVVQSSRQIILDVRNDTNNNKIDTIPSPPRPLPSLSSTTTAFIRGRIVHVRWIYLDDKRNNNSGTNKSKSSTTTTTSPQQRQQQQQQQQQQQKHLNYILIQQLQVVDDDDDREQKGGENNSNADDVVNENAVVYDLVFLTHFPMDTCLQYGLRVGAIVQAANLEMLSFVHHHHHRLHDRFHGARSRPVSQQNQQHQPRRVLAATLRSTVTLVRPAASRLATTTAKKGGKQRQNGMENCSMIQNPYRKEAAPRQDSTVMTTALPYAGMPFAFVPTKKGRSKQHFYLESFCRFKAKQWCRFQNDYLLSHQALFNDNNGLRSFKHDSSCLVEENLTRALLARANDDNCGARITSISPDNAQKKPSKKYKVNHARNPYAEFFNCCQAPIQQEQECTTEEDGDEGKTSRDDGGTQCVMAETPTFSVLPSLVSLDQVHETSMRLARTRLFNELQQRQGQLTPGWTGSFVISADDFSSIQPEPIADPGSAAEGRRNAVPALWTGGVTLRLDKSDVATNVPITTKNGHRHNHCLFNLSNGRVALPTHLNGGAATAAKSLSNLVDYIEEGSLVWVEVQSVVVSCVCLGKVQALDNTVMKCPGVDEHARISHLPLFHDADSRDAQTRSTGKNGISNCAFGPCSLVEIEGHLFVVSVYICASGGGSLFSARPKSAEQPVVMQNRGFDAFKTDELANPSSGKIFIPVATVSSIQACLDPTVREEQESSQWIIGLMVRKFFKLNKPRSGLYNGCMFTLSHIPVNNCNVSLDSKLHSPYSLQWIDVKTSVTVDESKRHVMRHGFDSLFSSDASASSGGSSIIVSDDQITLAMIWWQLACSARTCALLSGGWDELSASSCSSAAARKLVTVVQIPRSAAHLDPRRGYVRFRGIMQDVSARVIFVETADASQEQRLPARAQQHKAHMGNFDFAASDCFFPGMLESRCRRVGNIPWGVLATAPNAQQSGIPTCTLADMHWSICSDLRNSTRVNMAASLVRQVCGATFLGISYCRALAECTKCFKALVLQHDPTSRASKNNSHDIKVHKNTGSGSDQQKTFWHLPLPMHTDDKRLDDSVNNTNTASASGAPNVGAPNSPMRSPAVKNNNNNSDKTMHLKCPNHCNVNRYATIKWECSGTLDDGTGQAVLYAERNVALTLMGMLSRKTVQQIEDGAWRAGPNGIVYKKVLPPSPQLRSAITKARALAHEAAVFHRGQQPPHGRPRPCRLQEDDVLLFLTPTHRADFLLQRHCRSSSRSQQQQQSSSSSRSITFGSNNTSYLVRCKPLSDEISSSLNHTEITTFAASPGYNQSAAVRKVSSYALPPLKLNLVDMAVNSNSMECGPG